MNLEKRIQELEHELEALKEKAAELEWQLAEQPKVITTENLAENLAQVLSKAVQEALLKPSE